MHCSQHCIGGCRAWWGRCTTSDLIELIAEVDDGLCSFIDLSCLLHWCIISCLLHHWLGLDSNVRGIGGGGHSFVDHSGAVTGAEGWEQAEDCGRAEREILNAIYMKYIYI